MTVSKQMVLSEHGALTPPEDEFQNLLEAYIDHVCLKVFYLYFHPVKKETLLLNTQKYEQYFLFLNRTCFLYIYPLLAAETIFITSLFLSLYPAPTLCLLLASIAYKKPLPMSAWIAVATSFAVEPSVSKYASGRIFPFLSISLNSSCTG